MTRAKFGLNLRSPRRDPFGTARKHGLHLRARERSGAMLRGDRIYYDGTASLSAQRAMVAACIAKHLERVAERTRKAERARSRAA
jgi:hypothetical protein